jgi:hypothetical protein
MLNGSLSFPRAAALDGMEPGEHLGQTRHFWTPGKKEPR